MTLERWSLERYRMPHLDLDAIRRLDDGLEVSCRRGVLRLACSGTASIDTVLPTLESLRDPRSALWSAIRRRDTDAAHLSPMLREFDHLGLIRDCSADGTVEARAAIGRDLRAWSDVLGRDLAARGEPARLLVRQLAGRLATQPALPLAETMAEPNFAVVTMLLQARHLRADAPTVLGLLIVGLLAAERRAAMGENEPWWREFDDLPAWAEEEWSCGLADPRVIEHYLAAVGALVRDALEDGAARRAHAAMPITGTQSGINFLLDLEGEVERELAALGPAAALTAMHDPVLAPRVIRAAFLQEYLVTCRFVDCIAPLLSRRFPRPLAEAVHRYFAEEVGHEKFERENCMRLGMSPAQIESAVPMPLHLAFTDILTCLARESPIAFFCASMFTEGFIGGDDSLVSLASQALPGEEELLRAIGRHVAVNDSADHRGVGRDWMSHVPQVSPRLQAEVRELVAFLTELNWRMWEQLVRHADNADAR